jgi:hypothetical protein
MMGDPSPLFVLAQWQTGVGVGLEPVQCIVHLCKLTTRKWRLATSVESSRAMPVKSGKKICSPDSPERTRRVPIQLFLPLYMSQRD